MKIGFANRQGMHLAVLRLLDSPELQGVWDGCPPAAFGEMAAELMPRIAAIGPLASGPGGAEGADLESVAHEIGLALAGWFESVRRPAEASRIDQPLCAWQRLRDNELVSRALLLHHDLTIALAADPLGLARHGLDSADAAMLAREIVAFEESGGSLRSKFREISDILARMDRLVPRFRHHEDGMRFAAAWDRARTIQMPRQAALLSAVS